MKTPNEVMRALLGVWGDFSTSLSRVPLIEKLERGKFRVEDYRLLLLNQRQQVIEGARWIALASSSVTQEHFEARSTFMKHAVTEHRDFRMMEQNFVSVGGKLEDIQTAPKNIGTEAFSAYMFHKASQENPFDLLGAMFIIEGLGQKKALEWGQAIKKQLNLQDDQVSFLMYHGHNDENHMEEFERMLSSGILAIEGMGQAIVKTAKTVARLYRLQLEEVGNY